jgi:tetratricopeptide (TPR) repeat protein
VLDHYLHTAHAGNRLISPNREPITLSSPHDDVTPEPLADAQQAVAWFRAEEPVLRAAVDSAARHGFDQHAWQLPWATSTYMTWHAPADTCIALIQAGLQATERLGDRVMQARHHRGLVTAYLAAGRHDQAREHVSQARALFVELDDPRGEGDVLYTLGDLYLKQGEYADCLRALQQSLACFRRAASRHGEAQALGAMGTARLQAGDYAQAIGHSRQALSLFQALDDAHGQAAAWHDIGEIHHHLGEFSDALTCFDRSIELLRRLGGGRYEAEVLDSLGDTQHALGDREAAIASWAAAAGIYDEIRAPAAAVAAIRAKLGSSS